MSATNPDGQLHPNCRCIITPVRSAPLPINTKSYSTWRDRTVFGRPWQDVIFAIGEVVFLFTLIPLLFRKTNVPLFSGLGTAFMLYTFVAAHVSYRNWITVCLTSITATLWILIGLGVHL